MALGSRLKAELVTTSALVRLAGIGGGVDWTASGLPSSVAVSLSQ